MSSILLDTRYCQEQLVQLNEVITEKYVSPLLWWSVSELDVDLKSVMLSLKSGELQTDDKEELSILHREIELLVTAILEMCEYELG